MRCPLCQRDVDELGILHRVVSRNAPTVERSILCGYTSRTFLELDALPSTVLSRTIRRLWEVLDYHIANHDEPAVEARGPHGWEFIADIIDEEVRGP